MSVFSSGTFIKNRSKGFTHLLFILLVSSLMVIVFGQTRWQDLTAFHPYCVRLFRSCVNSSSVGGVGSNDYDISVGICGNKMAICTSSGNLTWPWSSNFYFETNTLQFGLPRPASASIFAEGSRLITYRNILTSPPNVTGTPWQNVTAFLPDCNAIFRRCVDTNSVVPDSIIIGGCGHGMSICTERQGRWPFGNESSTFWTQPYSNERLNVYRNAYSRDFNFARSWRSITDFHPLCRNLMAQCVSTSRDPSSNDTIGLCGNRMAICTSENILWPHSYDKSSAYTEPYDARWQRYATNLVDSTPRWLDIRRFSNICTDKFFECVYASPNATEDAVIGVCGNQMSICTFNNNIWPNVSEIPTTPDSYSTRLGIYHAMFDNMSPSAASYFTFPPLYWELYSFSTHTFTNAGATGRFGPTLSGTRRAYASQPWAQNSILFDTTTRGIQLWTVPATAWYRITCAGAKGGDAEAPGGNGAQMTGDFYLARATVIAIIVGQQGGVRGTNCNAGGGGGSFVWNTESTTEPLIAAGGGGGGHLTTFGSQGVISVNGTFSNSERTAGSNGMGGTPGGAGWKSHGGVGFGNSNTECWLRHSGGMNGTAQVGAGGFGGGAGAGGSPCTGGGGSGGGGGYSGGAGPSRTTHGGSGGGGGSYNNGTNQRNTAGANSGHGFVIITKL